MSMCGSPAFLRKPLTSRPLNFLSHLSSLHLPTHPSPSEYLSFPFPTLRLCLPAGFHVCSLNHAIARSGEGERKNRPQRCKVLSSSSPPKSTTSENSTASVTWGIIPRPPKDREQVLEYLRREGIDTTELQDVELPTSLDVTRERLNFLKKIGLRMEAINNYPLLISCSVNKNLIPVLDYLVELGVTEKALPNFLEKYPMVLHFSVVVDLMPVIDYLQGLDIRKKHIPRVLLRFPDVLGFKLEGTISTSIAYLVGIGVDRRSIGRMLTEYPEIMGMRVANMIKPKVDFLVSLGIPRKIVARILEMRPQLLGYSLAGTIQPAVEDLRKAGVTDKALLGMITHYPDILGQNLSKNLTEKTQWLVEKVRIASCKVPRIFEQLPQLLFLRKALAMGRIAFLRKAGFSVRDVAEMVLACPQLLCISINQALRPGVTFLLRDMKRSMREVVKFPAYFTYNLATRIQPRHSLLAKRGIKCSLEWFLNCSDQRFQERLEAGYVDYERPGPIFGMGGPMSLRVYEDENMNSSNWENQSTLGGQPHTKVSKFQTWNLHEEALRGKDINVSDDQVRYWAEKDRKALPVHSQRVRVANGSKAEKRRRDTEDALTSDSDGGCTVYLKHRKEQMPLIYGERNVEEFTAANLQLERMDDEDEDDPDFVHELQVTLGGGEEEHDLDMSESASEFDESENDNSRAESEEEFDESQYAQSDTEEEYSDSEEAELFSTATYRGRRP